MQYLLFASFLFTSMFSLAQKTIDVNSGNGNAMDFYKVVGGTPILSAKFSKVVEGSPYFNENWLTGKIILSRGKEYPDIPIKLNLIDNQIIYKEKDGTEMTATTPIKKIILSDVKGEYTFINSRFLNESITNPDIWYQLLSEGKASVLKQFIKTISNNSNYNSATIEQTITTFNQYFVLYNNQIFIVKKIKDLAAIFPAKQNELLKFINDNNIHGKTDKDFITVINFYNSLK